MRRQDRTFDRDLLDYLHSNAPSRRLQDADTEDHQYHVWENGSYALQSIGHGDIVVHNLEGWDVVSEPGCTATIKYLDGTPSFSIERLRGNLERGR